MAGNSNMAATVTFAHNSVILNGHMHPYKIAPLSVQARNLNRYVLNNSSTLNTCDVEHALRVCHQLYTAGSAIPVRPKPGRSSGRIG